MPEQLDQMDVEERTVRVDLLHLGPAAPNGGCRYGRHSGGPCYGRHNHGPEHLEA